MKRIVSLCCTLLVLSVLVAGFTDSSAAIKVKNIGRSLNSMTLPIKGSPAPAWNIATGLRAVGIQSRAYITVDTLGSGAAGTPTWSIVSKPGGSTAVLDSANGKWINSIKVDIAGEYVFSATVGTQTANDTIYASTYAGVGTDTKAGCTCHSNAAAIKTAWSNTRHAKIFKDGMTGYLEVELGKGAYAAACIKCHTNGWDPTANNGNFGYLAKQTGFDTSWYSGLQFFNGDYWIPTGDTTKFNLLNATQKKHATIGCEVCHGPATDHKLNADPAMIGKSIDAGVCNQCHDGSRRHSLGTYYNLSLHAKLPTGTAAEGGRSNCQPCHTGKGFLYYLDHNKDTTGIAATWNIGRDAMTSISCQVCHDPHDATNPAQLRTVTVKGDSLRNGYILPANLRTGVGLLCANCHSSRYSVKVKVKPTSPPMYGFGTRYGPHENPQADMFFGSNAYQFGDESFTGVSTHTGLEGGCATCHMQGRMNRLDGSANTLPNHTFSMSDTTFATGVYKPTQICGTCHGEIEDFNDIRAGCDYDRNGAIQGVQTEVQGMLNKLKLTLPLGTDGEPLNGSSGTLTHADSVAIQAGGLRAVAGIYNYYFVKNDKSLGIHNTKYAVALLYKSLGWTPLSVKSLPGTPTEFALTQNYPNPFNPTTNIRFSLPSEQHVRLDVYTITGSLVKTILNEGITAGNKEVVWDGTNASGAKVASGMYLYRLQAGSFASVKKMVMLK